MNKETKVGLLVGLSFIVLFGVILSNHAPDIASPPEKPMLAPTPPRGTDVQVIRQIATTTTAPPQPVDVIADATGRQSPAAPSSDDQRPAGADSGPADTAVADATPAAGGSSSLADATAPREGNATAPGAVNAAVPGAPNAPRIITADDLGPEIAEAEPGDNGVELLSSKVAPDGTRTTVYIVKSGDCLAKIARLYYGDASNRNIDKIYEANKQKMPNKRTLAVGTKLEVPVKTPSKDTGTENLLSSGKFDEVAELKPTRTDGDAKPKDPPSGSGNDAAKSTSRTTVTEVSQEALDNILLKPPTPDQPAQAAAGPSQLARTSDPLDKPGEVTDTDPKMADKQPDKTSLASRERYQHYQIQKGDTWYKLAARFMGDGKRWHDLYALNDDILPDATKLRTGVKIRVPAAAKGRLDSVVE